MDRERLCKLLPTVTGRNLIETFTLFGRVFPTEIKLLTKIMTKITSDDEMSSLIHFLTWELSRYSKQYPGIEDYVFCFENDWWIAKPKHPFPFNPEKGYYLRNLRKLVEYIIDSNYNREILEQFAADMIGLSVPE